MIKTLLSSLPQPEGSKYFSETGTGRRFFKLTVVSEEEQWIYLDAEMTDSMRGIICTMAKDHFGSQVNTLLGLFQKTGKFEYKQKSDDAKLSAQDWTMARQEKAG